MRHLGRGSQGPFDGAGRLGRRFDEAQIGLKDTIPARLDRLADLAWAECWAQQLRAEKKSVHTIRAYQVAAKAFSTSRRP